MCIMRAIKITTPKALDAAYRHIYHSSKFFIFRATFSNTYSCKFFTPTGMLFLTPIAVSFFIHFRHDPTVMNRYNQSFLIWFHREMEGAMEYFYCFHIILFSLYVFCQGMMGYCDSSTLFSTPRFFHSPVSSLRMAKIRWCTHSSE